MEQQKRRSDQVKSFDSRLRGQPGLANQQVHIGLKRITVQNQPRFVRPDESSSKIDRPFGI